MNFGTNFKMLQLCLLASQCSRQAKHPFLLPLLYSKPFRVRNQCRALYFSQRPFPRAISCGMDRRIDGWGSPLLHRTFSRSVVQSPRRGLSRCFRGRAAFFVLHSSVRPSEGWKSMDKSVIRQDRTMLISIVVN